MNIKETKTYIAEDGTEFEIYSECANYEVDNAYILITDIPHVTVEADELFDGSSCNIYAFFNVDTKEQALNILKWAVIMGCKKVPMDEKEMIGKIIIADCFNGEDDTVENAESVYCIETISQNIARYAERVYNVASGIPISDFYRDKERE